MLLEPQAHIYSSKTDDELLVLAADPGSLLETAQRALADELRRRNLVVSNRVDIDGDAIPHSLSSCTAYLVRAKWVGRPMASEYADSNSRCSNNGWVLHIFESRICEPSGQNPFRADTLLPRPDFSRASCWISQLLAVSWLISLLGLDSARRLHAISTRGLEVV